MTVLSNCPTCGYAHDGPPCEAALDSELGNLVLRLRTVAWHAGNQSPHMNDPVVGHYSYVEVDAAEGALRTAISRRMSRRQVAGDSNQESK